MGSPAKDIKTLVREMNETWLQGRVDELGRFFVSDSVIAPPTGDHRVAVLRFEIRYSIDNSTYEETGRDILVLELRDDGWRIVWRTQVIEESTEP